MYSSVLGGLNIFMNVSLNAKTPVLTTVDAVTMRPKNGLNLDLVWKDCLHVSILCVVARNNTYNLDKWNSRFAWFVVKMVGKEACCDNSSSTWNTTLQNTSLLNVTNNETDTHTGAFSNDSQAGLACLFSLTMVLSIVGNLFVVLVFARGRRSRTDLRPFLINLAVADLIMAIFCMPFTFIYTMLKTWVFSRPLCPIVLFVQLCSVSGSVFTNMAIGMDRFLAVTFPLRSRLTKKRAKYLIVTIWICSVALSSVQFKVAQTVEFSSGQMVCEEEWPSLNARRTYTVFVFVLTYLIPLLILSITYSIVGILLWKRTTPGNRDHARDMHQLRSKRKVCIYIITKTRLFKISPPKS